MVPPAPLVYTSTSVETSTGHLSPVLLTSFMFCTLFLLITCDYLEILSTRGVRGGRVLPSTFYDQTEYLRRQRHSGRVPCTWSRHTYGTSFGSGRVGRTRYGGSVHDSRPHLDSSYVSEDVNPNDGQTPKVRESGSGHEGFPVSLPSRWGVRDVSDGGRRYSRTVTGGRPMGSKRSVLTDGDGRVLWRRGPGTGGWRRRRSPIREGTGRRVNRSGVGVKCRGRVPCSCLVDSSFIGHGSRRGCLVQGYLLGELGVLSGIQDSRGREEVKGLLL